MSEKPASLAPMQYLSFTADGRLSDRSSGLRRTSNTLLYRPLEAAQAMVSRSPGAPLVGVCSTAIFVYEIASSATTYPGIASPEWPRINKSPNAYKRPISLIGCFLSFLSACFPPPTSEPRFTESREEMDLPLELVETILDHIPNSADLACCSSVDRDWRILSQSRLFKSISFRKSFKSPALLEILQNSLHIPRAIRTVDVNFISLALASPYLNIADEAELVCNILGRITHPRSLVLRGPRSEQRITWTEMPSELQDAITSFSQLPTVQELEIDGWVFDIPAHRFFNMLAKAPSMRRLRLHHSFTGLYCGDLPWDHCPAALNLDLLDIHVDDHLDAPSALDFSQLFRMDSSSKLNLRVWLNTALWTFGNLGEFLTERIAEQVDTLELTIGFRNNYIYSLSASTQLRHLTLNARNSPAALQFARQTLSTLPETSSLRSITLKFCFYALPRSQLISFTEFLSECPGLRSVQRVHFDVTTNQANVQEVDFKLGILREKGWEATVAVNEGEDLAAKRRFFYLYSRY
ncbi:hypothetical protein NMY22_g19398 [Coprinellus aureogranulatus]|nr:hypothetical protein NMY22_g19398 [Coprinellus aureogranulatus]